MDFHLPVIGEGVYDAEMVRWLIQPQSRIKRGQPLLEVMTDKATAEVPAPFSGIVTELVAKEGTRIKVGELILRYQEMEAEIPAATNSSKNDVETVSASVAPIRRAENQPTNGSDNPRKSLPPAAPSVRHLARKMGIDLHALQGSGPGGRILLDDLSRFLQQQSTPASSPPPRKKQPEFDLGKPGTRMKLQGLRRKISEHMTASLKVPQYSYIDECDLSEVVRMRKLLREPCTARGIKLTFLPFFVKAVVKALQAIPLVNSTFNDQTEEITLHDQYHIGIAVAAPTGLIVPILKDANQKELLTIATEIDRLANEAKTGRSKLEELRGGTFTLTSVGSIGGLFATPILNHPEVGILGIGKVVKRPIYNELNQVIPAEMVYLSFTFDHRVIDGAIAAMFGNAVIEALQNPAAMLLPA